MTLSAIRTVHAVLAMATDLARTVDELNASLKANRDVIALLEREEPDLWTELRDRTRAKRVALQDPSKAPPPPPPPAPKVQPKPPPLPPLTQYRLRL